MSTDELAVSLSQQVTSLADEIANLRTEFAHIAGMKSVIEEMLDRLQGVSKSHYSVAEIAQLVDRSEYRVRQWIKAGQLNATRVAGTGPRGRLLIPREELSRLVSQGRGESLSASVLN